MRNLSLNLSQKLFLILISSLFILFSLLGYLTVALHQRDLEEMTIQSADRISDTIKRGTHYSMLKNHRDEVYRSISTIGAEPGMNKVRIFNEQGQISFSTDPKEVNKQVDLKTEACYACHASAQPLVKLSRPDRVRIYPGEHGERILGIINPIENEPACSTAACHAHPDDQKVLGVLDVTMSLARVDQVIDHGRERMMAYFFLAILAVSLFIGGVVWYMIHRPVVRLIKATSQVAAGRLDPKIKVVANDELGELATSFNRMTEQLQQAQSGLKKWAETLELRVADKTAELQKAQDHLLHAERMASIGKLAAIVAHEINNPLAGILTCAKLLLRISRGKGLGAEDRAKVEHHLDLIAGEAARCGDIVKNLLQFSRQAPVSFQLVDINALISQSLELIHHKAELLNVQSQVSLAEELPPVLCDPQQIKQALVALFINACEAMTKEGGSLVVSSSVGALQAIEIRIEDEGIGMDAETIAHIFEPFFTTKEEGKGVGLGLAVVYGIVQRHGGTIDVASALGQGTTFTLKLPLSPEKRATEPPPEMAHHA